ncbi:MAG TPA: PQQ-binding-like beta-propeller repeat protein [Pirellulaceae bacterium]|nr:PQQ-binding-like beta-propeller repeat protein [Pirellulaceae bacterium]
MTSRHYYLSMMLAVSVITAQAEDWPRWRGSRGDGTWTAPPISEKWPAEGLEPVWKQPLAPGYSGISVSAGRVYTMDRPWADAEKKTPADEERIVCFDAASGEPLWEHRYAASYAKIDYPKGPRCTPTVHDGRVYTLGTAGHLHCLDAATGEVLWSHDLVAESKAQVPMWGLAASPVIEKDLVIVHAGLAGGGCYSAYDRLTGKEVWRSGDDPAGYGTPIVVDHAGIRLLVGWNPEHVVGINAADGELLWKIPYKVTYGVSMATPIFHEGIVLVCGYWEGSKAIKLGEKPEQAELLWEDNRYLRGVMDQPLYKGGIGFLLDKQHGIVGFRYADGEKLWTDDNRLHPRDRNPQVSMVWLGNTDRAIALNAQGELILIRLTPEGLIEQSRTKIVGNTWAHPAYAGEHVYARDDEQIVCVRLTDK